MIFIGQTADDIRTKLQKTEGGPGKAISELVELAYKVYINQAQEEEKKEAQKARRNAIFLAEALRQEMGKGRGSRGRGWRIGLWGSVGRTPGPGRDEGG